MTWLEVRSSCEEALGKAGIERPARVTLDWFDDVFGLASRRGHEAIPTENLITINEQLERLESGEPLAYVTGIGHFYGYELEVGEGVLIPRPETEELVRWILEAFPKHSKVQYADICAGSGCIAVALGLERLTWKGVAVDISDHAIAYTEANIRKHDLADILTVVKGDLLSGEVFAKAQNKLVNPGHSEATPQFDLLVSNPPYIPDGDWDRVQKAVADWEPHIALKVFDTDPLLFYKALCLNAKKHLREGGWLYVECNDVYAQQVSSLFESEGLLKVEIFTDMQGKERHVRGTI